jgi:uncharacterized protein (DUF2235 family)
MTVTTRNHVYIIDGTLSSLDDGRKTHAGRLYRLLSESGPRAAQSVGYHPGVQGRGWRKWLCAATGDGLNQAILDGYAAIASRYRPGDRIFLFGYSRGAYAVRSIAGLIDQVGLLRQNQAVTRRIKRAFSYYQAETISPGAAVFRERHCHESVEIEMIGAWDTVKALGPPYPILSRLAPMAVEFHNDALGHHIRAGYHALALDEDRTAFTPVMWRRAPGWNGQLEQVWFPGAHGDVGGDRGSAVGTLPLTLQSFRWMLSRAEQHGLILPEGWERRFPCDPLAPMVGAHRGLGKLFLLREPREVGARDGEALHESVIARMRAMPRYHPRARMPGTECLGDGALGPA